MLEERPCKICGTERPNRNGAYCSEECRRIGLAATSIRTNRTWRLRNLKTCRDCGCKISTRATRCIECHGISLRISQEEKQQIQEAKEISLGELQAWEEQNDY
jgi:ribosomal protein L40E